MVAAGGGSSNSPAATGAPPPPSAAFLDIATRVMVSKPATDEQAAAPWPDPAGPTLATFAATARADAAAMAAAAASGPIVGNRRIVDDQRSPLLA